MKGLLLFAVMTLTGLQTADASDRWTTEDYQREAIYQALHIVDWGQTRNIAKDDDYHELNPILGRNPSASEVDRYFLLTSLLHVAVADALPGEYRRLFQDLGIGVQLIIVNHNYRIGLSMRW